MAPGSYNSAAIIMLTDGQRTTGPDSMEAAKMAAERGVAAVGADNLAWDATEERDPETNMLLYGHLHLLEVGSYCIRPSAIALGRPLADCQPERAGSYERRNSRC